MRRHIPNALTLGRIALAIAFFAHLSLWRFDPSPETGSWSGKRGWPDISLLVSAALFVIAAVTDALDGYLARRWEVVSAFGRVMDPFADKVLVIGAFILLAGPAFWTTVSDPRGYSVSGFDPWMVVVILGRELLVTSIRAVFEARGVPFPATFSGKLKMIIQSAAIPLILVLIAATDPTDSMTEARNIHTRTGIRILAWATVIVTVWSAIPYVARAIAMSRKPDTAREKPQP